MHGQGLLIDLKVEALRKCGCAMCAKAMELQEQALAGSSPTHYGSVKRTLTHLGKCQLYQTYKEVSQAALLAEHRYPTMLYQLELRAPKEQAGVDKEQVGDFWRQLRNDTVPCAKSNNVHEGGEPVAVSLSRGFLDYLLLMPEVPATGTPLITATVIDAKATTRVKVCSRASLASG